MLAGSKDRKSCTLLSSLPSSPNGVFFEFLKGGQKTLDHKSYSLLAFIMSFSGCFNNKVSFCIKLENYPQGLNESYIPELLLNRLVTASASKHPPVCAILGGFLGQEVIKAISGKGDPIKNFFYFDAADGKGIIENIHANPAIKLLIEAENIL